MQSSLNAFVVRGATAAQQRQLRERAATEAEAKKASEVRIRLAWLRCGRRRVGAPSRQDRWVELLYAQTNQGGS